jgi:hypothetical protein
MTRFASILAGALAGLLLAPAAAQDLNIIWDVAVESAIGQPVRAGDELLLAFWARLEKGDGGATTTLPFNAIQLSAAPYTALFAGPAEVGAEWKLHEVRGKATTDHAAGTLKATIHLATASQTVEFGPIFVVNLGQ